MPLAIPSVCSCTLNDWPSVAVEGPLSTYAVEGPLPLMSVAVQYAVMSIGRFSSQVYNVGSNL